MTIRNLDKMFAPQSVAFVGASPTAGSIGRIVTQNLFAQPFRGPVWLVNPRHTLIEGHACYPSVGALPSPPDLAVIATPPETLPSLIGELGAIGTRAAVVITAGLTPQIKQAMLDAARPHLLRIQGPNCLGLALPALGLNASFSHIMPPVGDLALLSQSGAIVTSVLDWAASRKIGFSHVVSLGDMADADFGDLLDYFAGDLSSRAILLYMEHLTDARKFMSAARRASRTKPVIVIKAGRHAEGARAAQSHTGALAGSDAAYDTAFRRAGMLRVTELEDLFHAAEVLSRVPRLQGEHLAILTNGGGAGVLATDRLADLGGTLARLDEATLAKLNAALPPAWSHANPVDIIGDGGAERYVAAFEALCESPAVDALLVMNCPTALSSSTDIARALVDRRSELQRAGKRVPPLMTNWLGEPAAAQSRALFAQEKIATFETPAAAVEGFMQLVDYRRAQAQLLRTPRALPEELTPDAATAREIIARAQARGVGMLSEVDAKALLAAYGIPVVPTVVAGTPKDVEIAAETILKTAQACVVKILSDDITHKSDVGGVALALTSARMAGQAATAMLVRVQQSKPEARIAGFTVQAMVQRPRAHELIVGMTDDLTFGPLIVFGAGGTSVEVVRDTAMALPPLDLNLAADLVQRTRIHRLLLGYRDRPAADLAALQLTLVKVSALVVEHPEILELDINPLLADERGVIALDARIRVVLPGEKPRQRLAIRPYPATWMRRHDIQGVGPVQMRPMMPTDALLYSQFIGRLSPEDMRMRFFSARPKITDEMIARFTQIDYAREMAFVAIDETTGLLLGVARLMADPDYGKAEFAVIVASDLKGRGLGWRFMQLLIEYGRKEGLGVIFGEVLSENTTMLRMCAELGFIVESDPDDASVNHVTLTLKSKG